jgi:antitoxin VapB
MASTITPLKIKDAEVYRMVREIADQTGQTLTDVVRHAVKREHNRIRSAKPDPLLIDQLMEIADRCASLPVLDDRSDDEIIGYDEYGIPR